MGWGKAPRFQTRLNGADERPPVIPVFCVFSLPPRKSLWVASAANTESGRASVCSMRCQETPDGCLTSAAVPIEFLLVIDGVHARPFRNSDDRSCFLNTMLTSMVVIVRMCCWNNNIMLPVVRRISGSIRIRTKIVIKNLLTYLQQDSAPAHRTCSNVQQL